MCISMCVSMCISRHTAPSCCRLVLLLRPYHFLQHHLFSHHITPYCQYTNSAVSAFVRLTRSNRSAFCSVGRVLTVPGRTCEESEAQGRVPGPATDLRVRSSKQVSVASSLLSIRVAQRHHRQHRVSLCGRVRAEQVALHTVWGLSEWEG